MGENAWELVARSYIADGLYGIYETYELNGSEAAQCPAPAWPAFAGFVRPLFNAPRATGLGSSTDCLKATGRCLGWPTDRLKAYLDLGSAMGYLNDLVQSCPGSQ